MIIDFTLIKDKLEEFLETFKGLNDYLKMLKAARRPKLVLLGGQNDLQDIKDNPNFRQFELLSKPIVKSDLERLLHMR